MPDHVDDLYGLPLDEFTAARNALAKELTREGDKATAADVKKLPKPSKVAWALNQIARRQPDEVDLLLRVGARLREAQRRALEGDASLLRAAARAEQGQVDRLLEASAALAGAGAEGRLRATLRAAATDPEAGERLRRGRLVADIETSGFGLEGVPDVSLPEPQTDDGTGSRREQEREQREARREAEHLRKQADIEGNRAQRMQDEAERAEQHAREARRKADEATERAAEAYRKADEAAAHAGI